MFTWGNGASGRLGHGDIEHRLEATLVEGPLQSKRAVTVSAGYNYSAAVTEDGELFTWGCGSPQLWVMATFKTSGLLHALRGRCKKREW